MRARRAGGQRRVAALPPVGDAVAQGRSRRARWRCSATPSKALKAQGIPLMTFTLPPATIFFRVHDPKAFGDDVSARRVTVVEANKTGKPIVGVEPGRDTLGESSPSRRSCATARASRSSMSASPSARNSSIAPSSASASTSPCTGSTARPSRRCPRPSAIAWSPPQDELKSVFDGATLQRDATLDGHPAALYLGQIKNYAGTADRGARSHQGHHRL